MFILPPNVGIDRKVFEDNKLIKPGQIKSIKRRGISEYALGGDSECGFNIFGQRDKWSGNNKAQEIASGSSYEE